MQNDEIPLLVWIDVSHAVSSRQRWLEKDRTAEAGVEQAQLAAQAIGLRKIKFLGSLLLWTGVLGGQNLVGFDCMMGGWGGLHQILGT